MTTEQPASSASRTMTEHTPGPWDACEPGDYGDFDGESRVVCSANPNDMRRIAVVHWSPRLNTAESDANARLIAAAPAMRDYIQRKAAQGDADAISILEEIHANS